MIELARKRQTQWLVVVGVGAALGVGALAPWRADADDKTEAAQARKELARLEQKSVAFRYVAKALRPSVVSIRTERYVRTARGGAFRHPGPSFDDPLWRRFFGDRSPFPRNAPHQDRKQSQGGMGSGVIVEASGADPSKAHVLTNNHVLTGRSGKLPDKIVIQFADKRKITIKGDDVAKRVLTDPGTDLAVITIDATDLVAAKLGDSAALQVGDWVLAIGNPFGLDLTVTAGIVSAKGRHQLGGLPTDYQDFIQTDAAINPGNSGGPLVNLKGEVVGVNTAIFSRSGGYMGIGFAVPSTLARSIMHKLLTEGKITRGYLGVKFQPLDVELARYMGLKDTQGVVLTEVMPGSPADKAGVKRRDVLLEIDGQPVTSGNQLMNTVAAKSVGKKTALRIRRADKTLTLTVTLGERPTKGAAQRIQPQDEADYGLEVQDLTPELARRLGYRHAQGVLITHVEPGSPAHEAKLSRGEVIREAEGRPVTSAAELRKLIRGADTAKGVLLSVQNPRGSRFAVLKKK
jgi:serine protease Do